MTVDEHAEGFPFALCFSSRVYECTMQSFLSVVKDNIGVSVDDVSVVKDNIGVSPDDVSVVKDNIAVSPDDVSVVKDNIGVSLDD